MYRVSLLLDTDEPGAAKARDLAKQCLSQEFGEVRTITVAEWLYEQQLTPVKAIRPPVGPEAEHHHRRYV